MVTAVQRRSGCDGENRKLCQANKTLCKTSNNLVHLELDLVQAIITVINDYCWVYGSPITSAVAAYFRRNDERGRRPYAINSIYPVAPGGAHVAENPPQTHMGRSLEIAMPINNAELLEPRNYPLIVFVHVPKTGGSTVSKVLNLCSVRGIRDLHLKLSREVPLHAIAGNCDWLSGHVARDRIAQRLVWLDRPVEYFATVRAPRAQLISTLNFSFHKFRSVGYYGEQTVDLERFDAQVMATDFSNPFAIIRLLLDHAESLLNQQARLVLGADFEGLSDVEIFRRLATYKFIAPTETHLPRLYRAFGFANLPDGADKITENVAKRYIDTKAFDSSEMQNFLAHYQRHDLRLYKAVHAIRWLADGRIPFRPAFLPHSAVTLENFDEEGYLSANPDVVDAINEGHFSSGRSHFETFGRTENRVVRKWVFPSVGPPSQLASRNVFMTGGPVPSDGANGKLGARLRMAG